MVFMQLKNIAILRIEYPKEMHIIQWKGNLSLIISSLLSFPGEQEGVSNLPELITQANQSGLGIDWMLAYTQLNEAMSEARREREEKEDSGSDVLPGEFEIYLEKRIFLIRNKKQITWMQNNIFKSMLKFL